MDSTTTPIRTPPSGSARAAARDLRRLWRTVLAVALPLGPLAVAVSFALRPFRNADEPVVIVEKILASRRASCCWAPSPRATWPGGAHRFSRPWRPQSTHSRSA
jgi:hypothetical protein